MKREKAIEHVRSIFDAWQIDGEYRKKLENGMEGTFDGCDWKVELAMTDEQLKYVDDARRIIVYYLSDYDDEMEADKNQWSLVSLYDLCWMLHSGCY